MSFSSLFERVVSDFVTADEVKSNIYGILEWDFHETVYEIICLFVVIA